MSATLTQPLAGRRIVVTRPAGQAGALMARLAHAGAVPIGLPVMDIVPADSAVLRQAAEAVRATDRVIFVSPTAIDLLWPYLIDRLPARVALTTVGAASAKRLSQRCGRPVLHPSERSDAEALAALPELAAPLAGQHMVLVKGSGGRSQWLANVLAERGATVQTLDIYLRQPAQPDWHSFDAAVAGPGLAALVLTSTEAVDWLFMLAGESRRATLQSLLYVAPHPRIADRLAQCGAPHCLITAADNDATVAALCEWFETHP